MGRKESNQTKKIIKTPMVKVNGCKINPHTQPSRSLTPQLSSKDIYGMFNRLCNCLYIIVDWRIKANLF